MPAALFEFPRVAEPGLQRSSGKRRKRKSKVHVLPWLSQKWLEGIAAFQTIGAKTKNISSEVTIAIPVMLLRELAKPYVDCEIQRVRVVIEAGRIEPGRLKFKLIKGKYMVVEDRRYKSLA